MFGRNLAGQSTFGAPNTSTPTSTPAQSLNSQLPQKSNGLFGNTNNNLGTSTPSPSGTFGNAATQNNGATGGLFGNAASQTNASTSNNLFGNKVAGAPASVAQPGGLFGNNASTATTGGGLFGNKPNPTGAPQQGGLFGNTNTTNSSTGGGLFGNANKPAASGGLFGNTASAATAQPTNPTGSLFGGANTASKPPGTSLFGNTATSSNANTLGGTTATGGLFGNSTTSATSAIPQSQGLFGNSTQAANAVKFNLANMPASITPMAQKSDPSILSTNDKRTSFSLPSNTASVRQKAQVLPSNIFGKLNSRLDYVRESSTRGLFSSISSKSWSYVPSSREIESTSERNASTEKGGLTKPLLLNNRHKAELKSLRTLRVDPDRSSAKKQKLLPDVSVPTKQVIQTIETFNHVSSPEVTKETSDEKEPLGSTNGMTKDQNNVEIEVESKSDVGEITKSPNITEYWCTPSPKDLQQYTTKQLASVSNFMIGRKGFGTISFNYDVDLTAFASDFEGLLFDRTVIFHSSKTVEVYPDHSTKPMVGYGLNVPATISLEGIYPIDKTTKKPHVNPENSSEIQVLIRRLKNMKEMEFISYNPFGGIWTFKVQHFSIWGLVDSEDLEMDEEDIKEASVQNDDVPSGDGKERTLAQSNLASSQNIYADNTQNNLLVLQNNSFGLSNNASDINDMDLVEEKPYEPNVNEQDLQLMEVDPPLSVANDWITQLSLASKPENSIYASESLLANRDSNPMSLLFSKFNKEFETMKNINRERRLTSSYSFAKFDFRSEILVKNIRTPSGIETSSIPIVGNTTDSVMSDQILDLHLKSVRIVERKSNKFPMIESHSLHFRNILPQIQHTANNYQVWRLCSILYDDITIPQDVTNQSVKTILLKKTRYEMLCNWIVDQIKSEIEDTMKNATDVLDKIFMFLLLNDTINASKLAIESKNAYLSVILSFLGSNDPRVAEYANYQLDAWETSGHQVEPKIRRIYEILAGTFFDSPQSIEKMYDQFSWLAILGLGLFYGKIDELTLAELVGSLISRIECTSDDLRYVSLQLFSSEGPIEPLFQDIKSKNNKLGPQFAWYFVQILRTKDNNTFSERYADVLSLELLEQLRIRDSVKQALFVSCFINNDHVGRQQITDLVSHHIIRLNQDAKNLLNDLCIPRSLIHSALAILDKYNGDYISEIDNLLLAELYNDAKKELLLFVAPKLILSYNSDENIGALKTLKQFLDRFPKESIADWSSTLGIYELFIEFILNNDRNGSKKTDIEKGLPLLMKFHNHKFIPACCTIIEKRLKSVSF